MNDPVSRKDLLKLTRGMDNFPSIAESNLFKAQRKNAQEAQGYMRALAPTEEGVTRSNSIATAYKDQSGTIGFAMTTQRRNRPSQSGIFSDVDADERIKAILFANGTDFFYGVWRLNKKRWRGRMRRAMTKSARELAKAL